MNPAQTKPTGLLRSKSINPAHTIESFTLTRPPPSWKSHFYISSSFPFFLSIVFFFSMLIFAVSLYHSSNSMSKISNAFFFSVSLLPGAATNFVGGFFLEPCVCPADGDGARSLFAAGAGCCAVTSGGGGSRLMAFGGEALGRRSSSTRSTRRYCFAGRDWPPRAASYPSAVYSFCFLNAFRVPASLFAC